MDFSTTYLGLKLRSPLIVSANPLSERLDNIKRMEDAGASAVVLYSLFEEQLLNEQEALHYHQTNGTESYAEAITYAPEPIAYRTTADAYLEHIAKAKQAVNIPIIASLNGFSRGGWTYFARKIEEAGADALELNLYNIITDPLIPATGIERDYLDIVRGVKLMLNIPIAVKLSPFFTNMAYFAHQLDQLGADGLVLFNRFYQPDIDLDTATVHTHLLLSSPHELRLPLHWIGILYGGVKASLAATTGIHSGTDALKAIMAGASVTMMASALLSHGIGHIETVERQMREWLEINEYVSIDQMRGSLSQLHSDNPSAFERVQYMKTLASYFPR